MKTCTYCGKEYPDDSVLCPVDGNPLSNKENPTPESTKAPPPVLPPPLPRTVWTDRQIRIFELILIGTIAFGSSILFSTASFFGYYSHNPTGGALNWSARILLQVSVLGLLWYVLLRRDKSFADLGLFFTAKDIGWSVIIYYLASYSRYAFYQILYSSGLTTINLKTSSEHVGQFLFGDSIFISTMLFQFVNPFFEELIARAYVMTEVKHLTNSMTKAVIISTLLQTSYHFYQGAPAALSNGVMFLIFSIYYAKTNRIMPLILAHLYMDVGATLHYWLQH
ncbi:MAG TPA: type II CAAX endopeptidase family protein [Verrucomicrobiae bacterium]|jgi:membrane protease YdiL (CAAX protease family)